MEINAIETAMQATESPQIYTLFFNADPIVQAIMTLLAMASIISWGIIFEKTIRICVFSKQIRKLERTVTEAAEPGADVQGRLAGVVIGAVNDQSTAYPGESPLEAGTRIEKAMRLAARIELNRLQPRLRFLATVGSTAPFVGLFGTVWGIMNSFTAIASEKNASLAVVAPGIAEALFATALGLVAAIPAVVGYNQIASAISRIADRINIAIAAYANGYIRSHMKQTEVR